MSQNGRFNMAGQLFDGEKNQRHGWVLHAFWYRSTYPCPFIMQVKLSLADLCATQSWSPAHSAWLVGPLFRERESIATARHVNKFHHHIILLHDMRILNEFISNSSFSSYSLALRSVHRARSDSPLFSITMCLSQGISQPSRLL